MPRPSAVVRENDVAPGDILALTHSVSGPIRSVFTIESPCQTFSAATSFDNVARWCGDRLETQVAKLFVQLRTADIRNHMPANRHRCRC